MGLGRKTIDIDKEKLYEALKRRGLSASEVSKEIGFERGYIASACHYKKMGLPGVMLLKSIYGIDQSEYELCEEPQPINKIEEPEIPAKIEIDYSKLADVIYTAVYNAVKKAWAE